MDSLSLNLPFYVKFLSYIVALEVSFWNENKSLVLQPSHDLSNKLSKNGVWVFWGNMTVQNWEHIFPHLERYYVVCAYVFLWFENKQICVCKSYRWVSVWGVLFSLFVFFRKLSFYIYMYTDIDIYLLRAVWRQLPAGTSKLWNVSGPKWIRTWAKKANAMIFLYFLSFQCHTLEWSILQIIKWKVEWLTNYQAMRLNQSCHNFTDSSFHSRKQVMWGIYVHLCCWAFSKCLLENIKQEIDATGQIFILPSSLTKTSTDLLWLDWLPAVCCCLFDFTLEGKNPTHSLFQFRACWRWLKCINKKASLMRALKYRTQCLIKSQNWKVNDCSSCLLMKVNLYHVRHIRFGLNSMCSSFQTENL